MATNEINYIFEKGSIFPHELKKKGNTKKKTPKDEKWIDSECKTVKQSYLTVF